MNLMLKTNRRIIFFLLVAAAVSCGQKAAESRQMSNKLENKIDSFLTNKYQNGKLNGNVLVVKNDKTLYEKSFGYTDGSKKTLLNKNYRFNLGSVYKEFPAVAILQLSEKNLLETDDKIKKHLPNLPEWSEQISIEHLLQYSSGLPTIKWDQYFGNNLSISDDDILSDLKKIKELEFKPGTDYLYTNYSPILLMKIVEKVSKQKFSNYAKEYLFTPLGLKDTVIKEQYPYKDKTLMAIPFNSKFEEDNYETTISSILFSSTTKDMYRWFEQLDSFKIVSKQSLEFLSEEVKEGDNIQSPMGLGIWKDDKLIEHSHHGSSGNYECVVRRFKQDDLTIVILTNQKHQNVYDLSNKISEIINKN